MNLAIIGSIPLLLFALISTGCAATEEKLAEGLTACHETRPEVCTQEYTPVCAQRRDTSHKTYSNDSINSCISDLMGVRATVDGMDPVVERTGKYS